MTEKTTSASRWCDDYANVVRMAEHLVDEEFYTGKQLLRFIEKPWKWTPEWEALNSPQENTNDDS